MSDYFSKWQKPQKDRIDTIYKWLEQNGFNKAQDWRDNISSTSQDVVARAKDAAEAIVRYTADTKFEENLRQPIEGSTILKGVNRPNLTPLTDLLRTVQEETKMQRKEGSDWLTSTVDALIKAADEQNKSAESVPPRNEHVVMLHGLGRSNLSLVRMQQNFENLGFTVTNIDYPSTKFKVEELVASYVLPKITGSLPANAQKIHFITHSMGGIVVRYIVCHHPFENMGRVVQLCPPNRGTEIVDMFRNVPGFRTVSGPAGEQMGTEPESIPNSLGPVEFELGVIMGNRSIDPLFSVMIPGSNDGKVSIERAMVDGMEDIIIMPHSHTFIMHSPRVIEQAIHFIEHGKFDHPED